MEINVLKYELEGCGGRLLVQFLFNESKRVHGGDLENWLFRAQKNVRETVGFYKIVYVESATTDRQVRWIDRP